MVETVPIKAVFVNTVLALTELVKIAKVDREEGIAANPPPP